MGHAKSQTDRLARPLTGEVFFRATSVLLAVLLLGGLAELWDLTRRTEAAALFGTWLVGKDWRDLFPSKRNTASWGLLPHRVPRD